MPEFRRDPITRRWTIIATDRALRPKDFQVEAEAPPAAKHCPFCAGNEHLTPPAIATLGPADAWKARVVPNKFPALRIEGALNSRPEGVFDYMNGVGAHEVIIESPEHSFCLHALPQAHLVDVLELYRDRMADLQKDPRFKFSLLFRNHGAAAGASIAHGHAQLIALPIVPQQVSEQLDGAERYWAFRNRNAFEDLVRQELEDGRRLVHTNDDFVVVAPYASRMPFELWIVPRFHTTRYEALEAHHFESLAQSLSQALGRLDRGLGRPAYNFIIHSAPYALKDVPWYRWHIQIRPRLTQVAGFEWGTGLHINPTAPEEAAEFLRGVSL